MKSPPWHHQYTSSHGEGKVSRVRLIGSLLYTVVISSRETKSGGAYPSSKDKGRPRTPKTAPKEVSESRESAGKRPGSRGPL